jgi:glucan phosphoethanolaminetransferase (alkaline phosphatase superfamily)
MSLIQAQSEMLDYYLYFNGIYTYYYIFNSHLNHVIEVNNSSMSSVNTSYGFLFGILQGIVYFTAYIIIVHIKYRSTNIEQKNDTF